MANLQNRVMNILKTPASEWQAIAAESTDIGKLYTEYIIPLSAIPVVANFLALAVFRSTLAGYGVRIGMTTALTFAILQYVMGLASVFIGALVVEWLAPKFKSSGTRVDALKMMAYASTAAWVAGAAYLIPILGGFVVLAGAIYSIYLFYLGLPYVMKTPADQVVIYMIVCAVVMIVVYVLLGSITAALAFGGALAAGS